MQQNFQNFQNRNMLDLCNQLKANGVIQTQKVYYAMLNTDRADFTINPYIDHSQYINYNVVISAPHMHAYPMEYLANHINEGSRVLDIGYGSGYLTVAFSKMMNDKGLVVGIEHIEGLCQFGYQNICKHNAHLIGNQIYLVQGDGRLGYPQYGPYNAIHVGAAAPDGPPSQLLDQLALGGRLYIPIGRDKENQWIYLFDKDINGNISYQRMISVRYVMLTSQQLQLMGQN